MLTEKELEEIRREDDLEMLRTAYQRQQERQRYAHDESYREARKASARAWYHRWRASASPEDIAEYRRRKNEQQKGRKRK